MGALGRNNPFVRRFMIRHWVQQRKLAAEIKPLLPTESVPELNDWEMDRPKNVEEKKNRVVFFISDGENGKTA